jgi:hypothetical protein
MLAIAVSILFPLIGRQFAPQLGDVDNNMNRADAVLSQGIPESFDLLVLPELAFSGMSGFCDCIQLRMSSTDKQ